MFKAALLIP
jgi:hypothetical protein